MAEIQIKKSLIEFLEGELKISKESIALVSRASSLSYIAIPMVLWQYGLIDLGQLNCILDWLDLHV